MESNPHPVTAFGLQIGYGKTVVQSDLSFQVATGQVFGILGGSGCGKSTLLKTLIGLIPPLDGAFELLGQRLSGLKAEARTDLLRRIGVMYQSGALFGSMSLLDNCRLPMQSHTKLSPEAQEIIARIKLASVGLRGFEQFLPAEISGGMKKRAAIARALSLEPDVLFLDEPSAGLDPQTSADLDQLILDLSRRLCITVVFVSHELRSIMTIADEVILLGKGQGIIARGSPAELAARSEPDIRNFFNPEAA